MTTPRQNVNSAGVLGNKCLTMTYFHRRTSTIIGAKAFHDPVRDGKTWGHLAMVVKRKRFAQCQLGVGVSILGHATPSRPWANLGKEARPLIVLSESRLGAGLNDSSRATVKCVYGAVRGDLVQGTRYGPRWVMRGAV